MQRKSLILLFALVMVFVLAIPAMAAQVYINGNQLDVKTANENGTTLVSLRAIFQSLGATVNWDESTQTVTASKAQTNIKLHIGSSTAYKNGQAVTLQVPGKVISGSTMVPLRFVSEALGASVKWDGAAQTINIASAAETTTGAATTQTKVHFIDVGQADAIYIDLPSNNDILIDAGNEADGSLVIDYLKNQNVDDIELLIATHPHEDHIGGIPAVLNVFKVEKIVDSGYFTDSQICSEYKTAVQNEGANYQEDNRDVYTFGDISLQILTGPETWDDTNDYSTVCRLDTGDIEFLFTGDAEGPAEAALAGTLDAEILKVGHHGSSTSSATAFLNKVSPEIAIISVGVDNSYGHPADETIQRLQNSGAEVYRTDINGNIIVATDGKTYTVDTQKGSSTIQTTSSISESEQTASTGMFVGSKESNKYHYPDCRYAESISPENEIWFKDAADAQAQGYEPCGVCKP